MALNAYRSEQRVYYRDEPTTYYGFHVTGSSFSDEIHPFTADEERRAFVEAVTSGLPLDDYDRFIVAALAALATYGSEWQVDANEYALQDAYPQEDRAALDAAEEFMRQQ